MKYYDCYLDLDADFVAEARAHAHAERDQPVEIARTHMRDLIKHGFSDLPPLHKPSFDLNSQFRTEGDECIVISALTLAFLKVPHRKTQLYMEYPTINGITQDVMDRVKDPNQSNTGFASPLYLSIMNDGWSIFTLLKHPEIDPNPDHRTIRYDSLLPATTNGNETLAFLGQTPKGTPLECLTDRYIPIAKRPKPTSNYDPDSLRYHYKKAIMAMIDAGAVVTNRVYGDLKIDPELLGAMDTLKQSGLTMIHDDDAVITLTDIKRMHAFGTLKDTFMQAQRDETLGTKLLALRDELPQWMEKQYGPAFDLLSAQGTWQDAVGTERGSWREGR